MDKEKLLSEYKLKQDLVIQDVIKCYLKLHKIETGNLYYDCRKNLWQMIPGDIIYTNGAFYPLVSYPRIDDTLKGVKCGHFDDEVDNKRKKKTPNIKCNCRKWYIYYKADDGKIKKTYPPFDGMTMISSDAIHKVIVEVDAPPEIYEHFEKGYVEKADVHKLLSELRNKNK